MKNAGILVLSTRLPTLSVSIFQDFEAVLMTRTQFVPKN
jgi:hypothetical protein